MISLASSRESRSLDLYLGYLEQVSKKNPSFFDPKRELSFADLEKTFFTTLEETTYAALQETFSTHGS